MSEKKTVIVISSTLKDKQLIEICSENIGWHCRYYSSVTEALPHLSENSIEKVFVDFTALTDCHYDLPRLEVCINAKTNVVLCFKSSQGMLQSSNPKIRVIADNFNIAMFLKEMVSDKAVTSELIRSELNIESIIGNSAAIKEARRFCEKFSISSSPLLLCGAVGTGKRYIAKLLQHLGGKANSFVEISLADLKNLYDWEHINYLQVIEVLKDRVAQKKNLFIYVKNFELLERSNQIRFLERFEKLHLKEFLANHIKVVFACSHVQPEPQVYDFFYKNLNGGVLVMPDLQTRKRDIVLLFEAFLKQYFEGETLPQVSNEVYSLLENYRWPGNVRELKQVAAHVSINHHGGIIKPNDLPEYLQVKSFFISHSNMFDETPRPLEAFEAYYIVEILKSVNGNISKAARQLGVTRNTIKSKLKKADGLLAEEYAPLKLSV